MIRSILAVIAGCVVFMVFGMATRATWSAQSDSELTLFGSLAGWLTSGYVAALISRRAYIAHAFAVFLLCAGVPAIIAHFTGLHRDWIRWGVGVTNAAVAMTWGGLFRSWQVSHRLLPNQSPVPSALDAASSALRSTSQVGVGSGHGR